ncbi:MAG TPA: TetR/AcrR family transcriptional regulator [Gemmatimonadaceae bacterium]|nr:TetR/AcrR family transcriptional regulator [Gemmatimonadaceae bacterium]
MSTSHKADPALRQDARRNRERLLSVAVNAFTTDANASLGGIARAAEVGIGTLYRHFPSREALIEAAYRNELEKLCAAAPLLLKQYPPDEALRRMMDRIIDYMSVKRGMAEALRAVVAAGGDPYNQSRARLAEAVTLLLDAGKSQRLIRDDVEAADVLSMSYAFLNTADPRQAKRLAAILADGLRYRTKIAKQSRPDARKKRQ